MGKVFSDSWWNRKLRGHKNDRTAALIWVIFSLGAFCLRPWASVVQKKISLSFSLCISFILSAFLCLPLFPPSHFLSLFCLPVPLCFLSHSPDFFSVQLSQDKCQRQYFCVLSCHHSLCYVRHCWCVCVCDSLWIGHSEPLMSKQYLLYNKHEKNVLLVIININYYSQSCLYLADHHVLTVPLMLWGM